MDMETLMQRQNMPLEAKIKMSQQRIYEWYSHFNGNVYVSFSGGKDSTVLLDLVRNTPGVHDVPAVFVDTGLEYPEVRMFARKMADIIVRPKLTFKEVIDKYGYPVISKEQARYIRDIRTSKSEKLRNLRLHGGRKGAFKISEKWKFMLDAPFKISEQCCDVMKKRPVKKYEKETGRKPYIGTMACESNMRKQQYLKDGCNSFDAKRAASKPMSFWTEQDVLEYLKTRNLEYAKVYGDIVERERESGSGCELYTTGVNRTGCMFCMFGVQLEKKPNRFQKMKETHPKQYDYCMNKLGLSKVLDFMGINYK